MEITLLKGWVGLVLDNYAHDLGCRVELIRLDGVMMMMVVGASAGPDPLVLQGRGTGL
jgi:hypothetical protein